MKNQWISILIVGMTLGTAWAIRGQFGHEQGAAWAGAIGTLALVIVSKRKDWYTKMLTIILSAAVGWGATGMISYGLVVGYGRSDSFPNALYGLMMLFVIGGLFGLIGGGLTGLSLASSNQTKVKWGCLLAEMAAGGAIVYYLLVGQLGILMTPPRSEAWAICFGAGLAMIWHMARNSYRSPMRVAIYTALGAGFGFAFGNFLQILGNVLEINFNMWNVMEYSIGFFGGISLAYSVFSSEWPEEASTPERWENYAALLLVYLFIPLIIFSESLGYGNLLKNFSDMANPQNTALISTLAGGVVLITVAAVGLIKLNKSRMLFDRGDVILIFSFHFAAYIIVSYILKGALAGTFLLNHHLYWVNFIIILLLMRKQFSAFFENLTSEINGKKLALAFAFIVSAIIILVLISISIHGEMNGAQYRFNL